MLLKEKIENGFVDEYRHITPSEEEIKYIGIV